MTKKLEALIASVPGVEGVTIVDGNSIINSTIAPNSATAFVQLKEWKHREHTSKQMMQQVNALIQSQLSEATAFAFGPPPIPGLGSSAGFSLQLQDRQGNTPQYLEQQARTFIKAAQERPEIGRALTLYRSSHPAEEHPGGQGPRGETGIEAGRREPDPRGLPRRQLREQLQPVRPPVPHLPDGRRASTA